jgi:2-C-methyl-D-erythritol 4-phosphate cytidylyltransferase
MNIAVVFAGGIGSRMNAVVAKPKQFLELNGKPIIIYTLELFENHPDIDAIVISCVEKWIPYLKKLLTKYGLTKIRSVVPGGETGQDSIYNGLCEAKNIDKEENAIVLIHDGVRPLIEEQTISDNIETVRRLGNCVTCIPAIETFVVKNEDGSLTIPSRSDSLIARAPQSFYLRDILDCHDLARKEGKHDYIDSCTLMTHYGRKINTVIGPSENIKITTPTDFFIFRAIEEVRENYQIFGLSL